MTARRIGMTQRALGALLAAALASCTGGTGDAAPDAQTGGLADASDKPVSDASETPDSGAPQTPDASTADADPGLDADVSDIPALCQDTCNTIGTCIDEPVPADCATQCTADLQDCSAGQLDSIGTCITLSPGPQCTDLITCLEAVTCIKG